MSESKLFKTGCCAACGSPHVFAEYAVNNQNCWRGLLPKDTTVLLCREHGTATPSRDIPRLIGERRRALQSGGEFKPKVGDRVTAIGGSNPVTYEGEFQGFEEFDGETFAIVFAIHPGDSLPGRRFCKPDSVRPSPPAAEPMPEMYGTPLICGDCGQPIENALEACKRTQVNAHGEREYVRGQFHAECPKPAPPPGKTSNGSIDCVRCGSCRAFAPTYQCEPCRAYLRDGEPDPMEPKPSEPTKPDPYTKHREQEGIAFADTNYDNRQIAKQRIAALESGTALDRLAARRQRQRAELSRDMSRDVRTVVDRMGVERTWDGQRATKGTR